MNANEFHIDLHGAAIRLRTDKVAEMAGSELAIVFKRSTAFLHLGVMALVVREHQRQGQHLPVLIGEQKEKIKKLGRTPMLRSGYEPNNIYATIRGFWSRKIDLEIESLELWMDNRKVNRAPRTIQAAFSRLLIAEGSPTPETLRLNFNTGALNQIGISLADFKISGLEELFERVQTDAAAAEVHDRPGTHSEIAQTHPVSDTVLYQSEIGQAGSIVVDALLQELEILDPDGQTVLGRRCKTYLMDATPIEFFPPERINMGRTGYLTALRIDQPKDLQLKITEGGVGERFCTFLVQAPSVAPTELVRGPKRVSWDIRYEGRNVYTQDEIREPLSWCLRVPVGKPMPRSIVFELRLPKQKPMLREPRVYRLSHLALIESAHTDFGLGVVAGWQRLLSPSVESTLEYSSELVSATWTIHPPQKDIAYKLEWDWWE